jgi:Zn-dependent protease with chaperone function
MDTPPDLNADSRGGQDRATEADGNTAAQQDLSRGIAALKAKDYATALSLFKRLEQTNPAFRVKAQMGLIRVYQRQGNLPLARQYCQDLLTSATPKVRQWAQQVLHHLPSQDPDRLAQSAPTSNDPVPTDRSGFMPLQPGLGDRANNQGPSPLPPGPDRGIPAAAAQSTAAGETGLATGPPPGPDQPHQSLFHFQQLNQPPESGEPPCPPDQTAASTGTQPGSKVSSGALPRGALAAGRPYRLWGVQILTAVITLGGLHWGLYHGLGLLNWVLRLIQWPLRVSGFTAFAQPHPGALGVAAVIVTIASPWLWDRWLAMAYGQRQLPSRQLHRQRPEALGVLRRVCRQRGWQLPALRLIPDVAPLSFSYGWSPRTSRIVVSQGLLETLTDEELAALYVYELSHLANWDLPVISGLGLLVGVVYSGYWRLARWGDQQSQSWLRLGVGSLASLLFGLFWLLRKLGLWLSRVRAEACDRTTTILSGQPGQQQRLLLTLTRQIAQDVERRGHLHPLLASLDLLMPLSPRQAISPGSWLDSAGLPRTIAADCLNPYRYWLLANNSHGILGERLLYLERWAHQQDQPCLGLTLGQLTAVNAASSPLTRTDLALQLSPVIGLLAGGAMALGLWFIGGVVNRLNWQQVSWLYQDVSIFRGGLLIGLGLGLLWRVNRLFPDPDTPHTPPPSHPQLPQRPPSLPVNGDPVTLVGTLLGPPGLANSLGQQLYLQGDSGILPLSAVCPLDWWRGLVHPARHPAGWLGRQLTLSGWQRRGGGRVWIDVAALECQGYPKYRVHSPQWTAGLGLAISLWGIGLIFAGG